jgi:succinate dehydrogenase cytochrome b subunit
VPTPASRPTLVLRLFSLSGVLPLGVFLVAHLAINARALRGDAAFARAVALLERIPALGVAETLFVFAPLVFHAGVGLWLVITRRPLATPSPYPRVLRGAMRATGVAVVAFLAMHLPELRFHAMDGAHLDGGELATLLAQDLSSTSHGVPWRGVAYLVGAGCATFHFAAGMWGFFATTRPGQTSAAVRRSVAWAAAVVGAVMWLSFANVVVFHATGARMFGGTPTEPGGSEPCPEPSGSGRP